MKVARAEDLRRKKVGHCLGFARFSFFRGLRGRAEVSMLREVRKLLAFLQMPFAISLDPNSAAGLDHAQPLHRHRIARSCQ